VLTLLSLETRQFMRDRGALAVIVVACIACCVAFLSGRTTLTQLDSARATATASAAEAADKMRKQIAGAKEPADTVFLAVRVSLPVISPVPRLADFSVGRSQVDPVAGSARFSSRRDTLFANERLDNPGLLSRGRLDLGFVVIVVAPLLLIALGYGIFSGDRDRGSATLILAQAGSPVRLMIARSLPRLAAILVPILMTACLLLAIGPSIPGRAEAAVLWLGMALLSLATWWSVILLVNSLRITSEVAGLALVGLWAALVLIIPAAVLAAAQATYPPPSRFAQLAEARAAEITASSAYDNDHPELAGDDLPAFIATMRKTESVSRSVERAVTPLSLAFDERLAAQQSFVRRIEFVSPPLLAHEALVSLAGTDGAEAARFRQAAFAYLLNLKARLRPAILEGRLLTQADIDALPRFQFSSRPPPVGIAFPLLLGLAGATFWIAFLRFRRQRLF
jgi:hypothetical protein